jgi:hypothetical protein
MKPCACSLSQMTFKHHFCKSSAAKTNDIERTLILCSVYRPFDTSNPLPSKMLKLVVAFEVIIYQFYQFVTSGLELVTHGVWQEGLYSWLVTLRFRSYSFIGLAAFLFQVLFSSLSLCWQPLWFLCLLWYCRSQVSVPSAISSHLVFVVVVFWGV